VDFRIIERRSKIFTQILLSMSNHRAMIDYLMAAARSSGEGFSRIAQYGASLQRSRDL
jgi:hypothetical protein